MFGGDAVRIIQGGCSLAVGLSRFDVLTIEEVARQFGDAAPDGEGRDEYMAALTVRSRSLDMAARALTNGRRETDRIVVPAAQAFGVTLEFRE